MQINDGRPTPLTYSITGAIAASSIGRTKLYELIAAGRLDCVKVGTRTLIKAESLHRLLELA